MPLYIDASALTPLIVAEPMRAWVQSVVMPYDGPRLVSDFAAAEVMSAISRLVRMRAMSPELAEKRLFDFEQWRSRDADFVATTSQDVTEAGALVRRFELKLRTPDALHIVLSRRCGATLMSLDRQMVSAAQAIGLPVLTPP